MPQPQADGPQSVRQGWPDSNWPGTEAACQNVKPTGRAGSAVSEALLLLDQLILKVKGFGSAILEAPVAPGLAISEAQRLRINYF